jgi:Uma2 family endonuclease
MTIDEMRTIKNQRGYSIATLSAYSGVPRGTLAKIFSGETQNPRPSALLAIEKVLTGDESILKGKSAIYREQRDPAAAGSKFMLQETPAVYGSPASSTGNISTESSAKESYTIEDYFALPDDVRKELIDGQFYDMAEPTLAHQSAVGYIHASLLWQIRGKGGSCMPFVSPIGVQLDQDDKTVVEPDVVVLCRRDLMRRRVIYGAPDFVLEVLSPSTRKKDMSLKLHKYINAGVREYLMIDPDRKQLISYQIENDMCCSMQPLEGIYRLQIFHGEIEIDLDEVRRYIEEMPGED